MIFVLDSWLVSFHPDDGFKWIRDLHCFQKTSASNESQRLHCFIYFGVGTLRLSAVPSWFICALPLDFNLPRPFPQGHA